MKTIRAIASGIIIWVLGVTIFTLSYYAPLLNDLDLQANIILSIALIPIVGIVSKSYFSTYTNTSGIKTGLIMLFTSTVLDATLTVPLLIIPNGGTYIEFFISIAFWLIVIEYLLIVVLSKRIWKTKKL
ncbi:hypothetical protein DVK85_07245 [Flavobacterium arcticum]|uniref:Uncharacterized protein n=1 Tax=Flavobacterium arcticum TaxID=1784713 RepID=A0A345HBU1_9FLAO|nr:DUF5367 family protein [Flavobacterium arcticum]AXG74051.1 hypothetical protein DVK85_07245 [Flavobacterium arcticum]KAF2509026.1 hypothetical protein E0W72_10720 [Flavobacterium arcticum]